MKIMKLYDKIIQLFFFFFFIATRKKNFPDQETESEEVLQALKESAEHQVGTVLRWSRVDLMCTPWPAQ